MYLPTRFQESTRGPFPGVYQYVSSTRQDVKCKCSSIRCQVSASTFSRIHHYCAHVFRVFCSVLFCSVLFCSVLFCFSSSHARECPVLGSRTGLAFKRRTWSGVSNPNGCE